MEDEILEILADEYDEDEYPGISDLVIGDSTWQETVIRETQEKLNAMLRDALRDSLSETIETMMDDYSVTFEQIFAIRALTPEAAIAHVRMLLEHDRIDADSEWWDVS